MAARSQHQRAPHRPLRVLLLATALAALTACDQPYLDQPYLVVPGVGIGYPEVGREAFNQYACTSCHVIPGVVGADIHVGPPLSGLAERKYLAGVLPNTPANLVRWIRQPQAIAPQSAMPNLGVGEQPALDMAAYLYRLHGSD